MPNNVLQCFRTQLFSLYDPINNPAVTFDYLIRYFQFHELIYDVYFTADGLYYIEYWNYSYPNDPMAVEPSSPLRLGHGGN